MTNHMLEVLARAASWAVPWLVMFAISASIAGAMIAAVAGAQAFPARTQPIESMIEKSGTSDACVSADDWMLRYAISTQRIPASYCRSQKSMPPGP